MADDHVAPRPGDAGAADVLRGELRWQPVVKPADGREVREHLLVARGVGAATRDDVTPVLAVAPRGSEELAAPGQGVTERLAQGDGVVPVQLTGTVRQPDLDGAPVGRERGVDAGRSGRSGVRSMVRSRIRRRAAVAGVVATGSPAGRITGRIVGRDAGDTFTVRELDQERGYSDAYLVVRSEP